MNAFQREKVTKMLATKVNLTRKQKDDCLMWFDNSINKNPPAPSVCYKNNKFRFCFTFNMASTNLGKNFIYNSDGRRLEGYYDYADARKIVDSLNTK